MFKDSTPYRLRHRNFSVWPAAQAQSNLPLGAPQNSPSQSSVRDDQIVWRVERLGPTVAKQSRQRKVRVQVSSDEDSYPAFRRAA